MLLSSLTIIIISGFFATITVGLVAILTVVRLSRLATLEARVVQRATVINTTLLQYQLQQISISIVEIDAEVAALKQDIINAAHKHHLTIDKSNTQPDNPFKSPQSRGRLLKVMEKREQKSTRVS